MTPMDLTAGPPRAPRAELAGIIFLPRSIDKVRATLPGGNPGEYGIHGFTEYLLEKLGIELEAFTRAVAAASSDADVVAFVTEHTTKEKIDEWHAFVSKRQPRGGNRVEALESYPWLDSRPDLIYTLDILEEDDKQHFAGKGH